MQPVLLFDFPPTWKGLYARDLTAADDPGWAALTENVEFRNGVIQKRKGTTPVNGTGTFSLTGWVQNNGSGQSSGPVSSSAGFQVGDSVTVFDPIAQQTATATVATVGVNALTFTTTLSWTLNGNSLIVCQRGNLIPAWQPTGLVEANWRDGSRYLLSQVFQNSGTPFVQIGSYSAGSGASLAPRGDLLQLGRFPLVEAGTIPTPWTSTSTGQVFPGEGMVAGDMLVRVSTGEQVFIASVTPLGGPGGSTIVVNPPFGTIPGATETLQLFPSQVFTTVGGLPTPALETTFAAMANQLHITTPNYPPMKWWPSASTTTKTGWSTTTGTVASTTGFVAGGSTALFYDPATGNVYYSPVTGVSGGTNGTLTVSGLPVAPGEGWIVQRVWGLRHGIKPPVTQPNVTVEGGANPGGPWQYVTKFVNTHTGAESEPSPVSTAVSPTTGQQTLVTVYYSSDPQVTTVRLYRTLSNTPGTYYWLGPGMDTPNVGFLGGPYSVLVHDTVPDSALVGVSPMRQFLDETIPDTVAVVTPWPQAQRMMGIDFGGLTGPPRVVWSDAPDPMTQTLKPESWPILNFLFIGHDSGDNPIGLAPFFDAMLVFCQRSIWRILGEPIGGMVVEPVNFRADNTGVGLSGSQQSIVADQNTVVFPSTDGFYQLNRYEGAQAGFTSERISIQINKLYDQVTNHAGVIGTFFRERRQLRYAFPVATPTLLTYQFEGTVDGDNEGWSQWALGDDTPTSTILPANWRTVVAMTVGRQRANTLSDACYFALKTGLVLQADQGYLDYGGAAYTFAYQTTLLAIAGEGVPALGRWVTVYWNQPNTGAGITPVTLAVAILTDDLEYLGKQIAGYNAVATVQAPQVAASRLTMLARGIYHQLLFTDLLTNFTPAANNFNTSILIQHLQYGFQALPLPARTIAGIQPIGTIVVTPPAPVGGAVIPHTIDFTSSLPTNTITLAPAPIVGSVAVHVDDATLYPAPGAPGQGEFSVTGAIVTLGWTVSATSKLWVEYLATT